MTLEEIEASLPADAERRVAERLRAAADAGVAERIWRRDPTLWAPEGTPEVADRLGWLTIHERLEGEVGSLAAWVQEVRADGFTDALLLGMGGSSLAPEVFRLSHGGGAGDALALHVLDTTEPSTIRELRDRLDPARTLVVVSTKSGGTIETLSLFKHFWSWSGDGRRFAAITDPGSGLASLAGEHGFRRTFLNDPEIGGRYSALSYFGLVPASLAGVDVGGQLASARAAREACDPSRGEASPGLRLGVTLGELARGGRDKATFLVDPPIGSFGLWVEQLVAESTGKSGRGTLPVADEPLAGLEHYGTDRVFVHIADADAPDGRHGEFVGAAGAAGHPTLTLRARGAGDLGGVFFLSEFATAVAGWVLGINPFDQPNVQEAKDNTARALRDGGDADDGALEDLLVGLAPPAYLAIHGYLPYAAATDAAVDRLRAALLERHGVATTFGYGPRFLHSTGQYHKGGPAQGRFLQLVHDGSDDLEVPGENFGFRRLISAQADGDLATLREHGLPAARVRLPADGIPAAIDALTERVGG